MLTELEQLKMELTQLLEQRILEHRHNGNEAEQVNYPELFDKPLRYIQSVVFDFTVNVATGDGKFYIHIPEQMGKMKLFEVHAEVITAGTTGTTDIQIRNVTDSVDMLSTKLTIDSGETGSDTAATLAVIDKTKDDVATNDLLAIDVDAVSTTPPLGLIVTLGFSLP